MFVYFSIDSGGLYEEDYEEDYMRRQYEGGYMRGTTYEEDYIMKTIYIVIVIHEEDYI